MIVLNQPLRLYVSRYFPPDRLGKQVCQLTMQDDFTTKGLKNRSQDCNIVLINQNIDFNSPGFKKAGGI